LFDGTYILLEFAKKQNRSVILKMKAALYEKYGSPEVLSLKEIEKPVPKDNEILIKIHATTVAAGDIRMRAFKVPTKFWLPMRLVLGFTGPKNKVLGMEVSGVVETIGKGVEKFRVGDEVFAATGFGGGYAEYICLPEKDVAGRVVIEVAKKPTNLTFEEAAAVPIGGMTALAFLRKANVKSEQKVLVYGASGSVGTYAVQLAKYYGAQVTGVCSAANLELVKSLGVDIVIDYAKEDFTKNNQSYDLVFDAVGKISSTHAKGALTENGVFLSTWGDGGMQPNDLSTLSGLIEAGKLKAVIDRTYPLEQIAEAHRYVETGHKKGNVAITVAQKES
jgi:NADPH:quinone reductase-like Zn-dependent oxidoreductase